MNEENEEGPKEGAIGLGRAVDRSRSSTVWSKSVAEQAKEGLQSLFKSKNGDTKEGCAAWPEDELVSLYVKDPSKAQLALTGEESHGFLRARAIFGRFSHRQFSLNSRWCCDSKY